MINISNNSNISNKSRQSRDDRSTRLKLCYILPAYDESTDSHFYHLYELLEELSKKLDIFLVIEKSKQKDINLGNRVYVQKFRFLPLRFLESFLIILRARSLGYKNFYTHYCYIGAVNAGIISRLTKGRSFYWHCEMIWMFRQKIFSKIGFNLSLKLSHFLVTGSEKMKEGYSEHYGLSLNKIKIMPNWVNLKRFKSNISSIKHQASSKIILFIHWLSKRKGADIIIPIALNFKLLTINYKLLIIGDGPYKEKLLEEIKENKLEKFIKVLGKVPNKEIAKYYALADILILPSAEEGFPRVLLEAMAMSIPYVAFDVGAIREISPETAQRFLVRPGDIEKLVYKIENLLSDKKIYNQFRREELEKVKEYSLDKVIDKFINLFS